MSIQLIPAAGRTTRQPQGLQGHRLLVPSLGSHCVWQSNALSSRSHTLTSKRVAAIQLPLFHKPCLGVCRAAPQSFEPHVDRNVLYAQLVVLAVTVGAAGYWWWTLVPTLRQNLAKEKRQGTLNKYLVDLQQNDEKKLERWFYTDWLNQLQRKQDLAQRAAAKRAAVMAEPGAQQQQQQQQEGAATAEREPSGLGTEAMQSRVIEASENPGNSQMPPRKEQQQQEDGDKEPFFWSLDNPIIATAAGLAVIAVVSSLLHKT